MSRGGRAAAMRGGRPKGPSLPFEIDPALAEAVDEAEGNDDSDSDDFQKDLFPDLDEYITARPVTDEERRGVRMERDLQAKRRAGPFWTGTREEWAEIDAQAGGGYNPFDGFATYSKKRAKKPFRQANLKRIKVCYPELLPKELQSVVTDSATSSIPGEQRKKVLGLAKKSVVDRLSRLDEDDVNGNTDGEADSENGGDSDKDEDEIVEDDDFDEDDEEGDNDYNAEKYFDDGEGDGDDYGGDDPGGDDGF